MYTIDLTLRNIPLPLSIQRKEAEDAEAIYQQLLAAMRSSTSEVIELTCEKEEGKKLAILSDQLSAVMISQKSGAAAAGRTPGFFAATRSQ
jgi:hypothetical protein